MMQPSAGTAGSGDGQPGALSDRSDDDPGASGDEGRGDPPDPPAEPMEPDGSSTEGSGGVDPGPGGGDGDSDDGGEGPGDRASDGPRDAGAAEPCTEAACGPRPLAPNYTCADGTLAGPGPCERQADGACGYTLVECPPDEPDEPDGGVGEGKGEATGATCGGIAGLQCKDGQFCNYEEDAGGLGCDGTVADAAGTCEEIPGACTQDHMPVCGCDRRSYSNACTAHSAGVSVLREDACTDADCESIGGRVVFGRGPSPMCAAGEKDWGWIRLQSGAIPIEGAICCLR